MTNFCIDIEDSILKQAWEKITEVVAADGGRAVLVGGCVRDAAFGIPAKDLDVEVYGIPPQRLKDLISTHYPIDLVGEAFGVIKVKGVPLDISIPRKESKTGIGHKGFDVMSDPDLTPEQAARRRDFTINSMAFDPLEEKIIDPFGGLTDLQERVLRHTSDQFSEDPLRVLRGMQLAARFELDVAPETLAICQSIEPEGLPPERIFEEWKKLILQGVKPSLGLAFMRNCGWVRYFPELQALIGCEQDPEWHPEGDVWIHTLHCMDAFASERTGDEWEDLVVGFAVLCHDYGKPATTKFEEGRIRSRGHEAAGEAPTRSFLRGMTEHHDLVEQVVPLVVRHLCPVDLYDNQAGDSAIRRLSRKVGRIDRLVRVARADQKGRPPKPFDGFPAGDWLLERANVLHVKEAPPEPIVMGRHLIELGLEPGPIFGRILKACYEEQLDGRLSTLDEGIEYAKECIESEP